MSGKDRFGAFARANNLVGVENSDSPPRVPRFNKPARLPSSEESHRAAKERELREAGMGEVSPVQRETRRSSRKREFPDSWVGESIPVQDHSKSEKREKEKKKDDDGLKMLGDLAEEIQALQGTGGLPIRPTGASLRRKVGEGKER